MNLLIQADARRIPLADKSVHMCVTSPPYWGLRDYQTGRWIGGDEACDHLAPLGGGFKSSTLHCYDNGLHEGSAETIVRDRARQYRDTCGKCGARRVDRQLGLEATPDLFVAGMVAVFREVKRVLRDDGTAWVNLGDSYAGSWGAQSRGGAPSESSTLQGNGHIGGGPKIKGLSAVQIASHPHRDSHTGTIRPSGKYRLRSDLTPDQVAYVLAELAKARSISADTQEGRS